MDNQVYPGIEQKESRHFLKRIASKLVMAVLVAVILPFFGLIYFIDTQIDTRLKENIVSQSLQGLAGDLANEVNMMIEKRNIDMLIMASDILGDRSILENTRELEIGGPRLNGRSHAWGPEAIKEWMQNPDSDVTWSWENFWRRTQTDLFNQYVTLRQVYDLILLIGPNGRLIACSTRNPDGTPLSDETTARLFNKNFAGEEWFKQAFTGKIARVGKHKSDLIPPPPPGCDPAELYQIGFAVPVKCFSYERKYIGVIYSLVNWKHIQRLIDVPRIKAYFTGLVKDKEPSPYAWIWDSDANTILAHKDRSLYGEKITGKRVNLPQMVEDALSAKSGLYREYTFRGQKKNAAFHHCSGPELGDVPGGFGWIVGVGIDNRDIYAMAGQLRRLLYRSTVLVIIVVIIWTMFVARRTTKPILILQKHMRKVSNGAPETRVVIDTGDEISDLADDFNHMLMELNEKRSQLIKVEKDAAWKEMAQQISHDIKNTLTPIKLSVDLLKQSCKDDSPDYKEILQQTLKMIDSQITNLQKIATDFYEFTGGRKSSPTPCDLSAITHEVLELNRAWAAELGIAVKIVGTVNSTDEKVTVIADAMKLHRVLTNIISNAFQAMPGGGALTVSFHNREDHVTLEIKDTGTGIPDDVRQHLFEPYFTTRSKGTGLGLAIAKRVVEEFGGTIRLDPNDETGETGTTARLSFPAANVEMEASR
jgi:signal transduction histidine kinase